MRILAVAGIALAALVGCGSGGAAADTAGGAGPWAQLTVKVWPQGSGSGPARQWTLRCGPAGGTHPNRARACRRLASLPSPFRPVPKDVACTQLYGGPQEAVVTGTLRGRKVNARFSRTDGCQIERWDRVAVLFPVAAGA